MEGHFSTSQESEDSYFWQSVSCPVRQTPDTHFRENKIREIKLDEIRAIREALWFGRLQFCDASSATLGTPIGDALSTPARRALDTSLDPN